jgi:hypothetical protein
MYKLKTLVSTGSTAIVAKTSLFAGAAVPQIARPKLAVSTASWLLTTFSSG